MGSVQHHQTQARRFLSLARSDHNAGDYARAANALARAASHAATAAAVEWIWINRYTRRRLTNYLFRMAAEGRISNGGVKTFRNIYHLPRRLAGSRPRRGPPPVPTGPQPRLRVGPLRRGRHRRPAGHRPGSPSPETSVTTYASLHGRDHGPA